VARVGTITDARIDDKEVKIEFTYELEIPAIPQGILIELLQQWRIEVRNKLNSQYIQTQQLLVAG
jgi:hypothetical protein